MQEVPNTCQTPCTRGKRRKPTVKHWPGCSRGVERLKVRQDDRPRPLDYHPGCRAASFDHFNQLYAENRFLAQLAVKGENPPAAGGLLGDSVIAQAGSRALAEQEKNLLARNEAVCPGPSFQRWIGEAATQPLQGATGRMAKQPERLI